VEKLKLIREIEKFTHLTLLHILAAAMTSKKLIGANLRSWQRQSRS